MKQNAVLDLMKKKKNLKCEKYENINEKIKKFNFINKISGIKKDID